MMNGSKNTTADKSNFYGKIFLLLFATTFRYLKNIVYIICKEGSGFSQLNPEAATGSVL